jgi:hypothetical protein
MTPVMTRHARERCEQMGISTKIAKQILRSPRRVSWAAPANASGQHYPGGQDCRSAVAPEHPDYAVIYVERLDGTRIVITVLQNTRDTYTRDGVEHTC